MAARQIAPAEFRARLEEAASYAIVPNEGIFGPSSVSWQLLRESVGFLGGGRAALLQTAHPWVANGVDQHSKTKTDPMGRFHRTFENVFTIIFGSVDQVTAVANQLNAIHSNIVGRIPDSTGAHPAGTKFFANQLDAMMWVHATLWETFVTMYELVVGPLDRPTKERFYREVKRFALCFGVPLSMQPPTWNDFLEYNHRMWESPELGVGKAGLEIGKLLFRFDLFPGSQQGLRAFEVFTAETMPTRLREAFHMPKRSLATRMQYQATLQAARLAYPRLPERVRYIPAYFEARDRLAGKAHSDAMTRRLSKFWTGREELVARDAWT